MIEAKIFGDEELDETGRDLVERLKGMPAEEYLARLSKLAPYEAANNFVNLIGRLDYIWEGSDENYFKNAAAILFKLAEQPGFYEALTRCRDETKGDELPSRASTILFSQ